MVQLHAPQIGFISGRHIKNPRAVRRNVQNFAVAVVDGQLHGAATVRVGQKDLLDTVAIRTVKDALAVGRPNKVAVLGFVVGHAHRRSTALRHDENVHLSVLIVCIGNMCFVRRYAKATVQRFREIEFS